MRLSKDFTRSRTAGPTSASKTSLAVVALLACLLGLIACSIGGTKTTIGVIVSDAGPPFDSDAALDGAHLALSTFGGGSFRLVVVETVDDPQAAKHATIEMIASEQPVALLAFVGQSAGVGVRAAAAAHDLPLVLGFPDGGEPARTSSATLLAAHAIGTYLVQELGIQRLVIADRPGLIPSLTAGAFERGATSAGGIVIKNVLSPTRVDYMDEVAHAAGQGAGAIALIGMSEGLSIELANYLADQGINRMVPIISEVRLLEALLSNDSTVGIAVGGLGWGVWLSGSTSSLDFESDWPRGVDKRPSDSALDGYVAVQTGIAMLRDLASDPPVLPGVEVATPRGSIVFDDGGQGSGTAYLVKAELIDGGTHLGVRERLPLR